jgi:signal transduction histidine kinase
MMDVSEFREAERATRLARDAAEEASRAKSEFIANISHELRTPLQSILGFSELGVMRGAQHPKLHAMFTDIHGSGTRMLALVNDLLDVSKIESSVGAVTLERADLRGLVLSVVRELAPLLAARQLQLVPELGPRALIAKVDPVRFAQVIRNVLANAIKFSPVGASIEVKARLTDEERIHITVRDHGAGVPPDELEKIFEAFVQSSTSKDGSGGTGLGLAICRKILAAHDGHITAANMQDGGAVFLIDIPARHYLD